MKRFFVTMLSRWLQALLVLTCASSAGAELPLFDTHLHYNSDHTRHFPPAAVVEILHAEGVINAVVTARPPVLVQQLHELAPDRIIPMLGVYRTAADSPGYHGNLLRAKWLERLTGVKVELPKEAEPDDPAKEDTQPDAPEKGAEPESQADALDGPEAEPAEQPGAKPDEPAGPQADPE